MYACAKAASALTHFSNVRRQSRPAVGARHASPVGPSGARYVGTLHERIIGSATEGGAANGMYIAIIMGTFRPERCGVAHYTDRLRDGLRAGGVSSVVLTTRDAARERHDPAVIGVTDDWRARDLPALVVAVRDSGADLLHIQHAAGSYGFRRAIFLLPPLLRASGWHAPIVTTLHEYGWWDWQPRFVPAVPLEWAKTWGQRRGWWDGEDGFLLTQSAALITTNDPQKQVVRERLPQLADRLHMVPLAPNIDVVPVDRAHARRDLREDYGWPEDAHVLAFFGFLHPVKGLETLLRAFRAVQAAYPQTRLLIVGGVESLALRGAEAWNYYDKLQALIGELALREVVAMPGYLPWQQASRDLLGADIGVLPFHPGVTAKSGSLLALWAHGLPLVVTAHDPPDPLLASGERALLVPPRDATRLARALGELVERPRLRARLAVEGRRAVQLLSWPLIVSRHCAIYEQVLAGTAPSAPGLAGVA